MSDSAGDVTSLETALAQYDWHRFTSFAGDASSLPGAVRALAAAADEAEAERAYWRIDGTAVRQGRLAGAALPVTACLLAALSQAGKAARERILDLLATIAGGYDEHVDSAEVGPVSVAECVRLMSVYLDEFAVGLYDSGYASYVDILLMCGVYEKHRQPDVARILQRALTLPSCAGITGEIETALDDLD